VGPLTLEERVKKVTTYWARKRERKQNLKIRNARRKKVADKKLRIKGRFVTKEQAIKLLGMTAKEV